MEKTVILLFQTGRVCSVMRIKNYDDGFKTILGQAELAWNSTKSGMESDYDSFVLRYVTEKGYDVEMDDGYETYDTCM